MARARASNRSRIDWRRPLHPFVDSSCNARVVRVSVAVTLAHAKRGQFVTHVKALPGNLYDRLVLDKGHRGHSVVQKEPRVLLS